ncbi:MAG TPA: prolyl oligopeptidase family serine peptidase [bacterium]|nr:prolyl oligopeptidase family serine peptidase [bacterium]
MRQAGIVFLVAAAAVTCSFTARGGASLASPCGSIESLADTLRIAEWRYLGPFSVGPREGITGFDDTPEALLPPDGSGAAKRYPSMLAQGGYVEWQRATPDSTGWVTLHFSNVLWDTLAAIYGAAGVLNVSYAWAQFETPRAERALVVAERVGSFYLNGMLFPGDPYGHNFVRIPVVLKQGMNSILVKLSGYAEPNFKLELIPAPAPLVVLDDYTTPDLMSGEQGRFWIGVAILNTTDARIPKATLAIGGTPEVKASEQVVTNLAALSVRKIPIEIEVTAPAEGDQLAVPIALTADGATASGTFTLRVRQLGQSVKRTFISRIDGSCQYYAVLPPAGYDPGQRYALLLTLHGAGVRAEGQADAYKPKSWAFIVAPTNRRPYGFDWQDWGRLDALEVLAEAEAMYPIDPDRVYLTGHSMGGHGVWHVGLAHPDLFAAMAPGAGWTSFELYIPWFLQRSAIFAEPGQIEPRNMSLREDQSLNFVENARNLPIFIFQGGVDDNVPPVHARMFVDRLDHLGYKYVYKEIPGKSHWWSIDSLGTSCEDDPDLMAYVQGLTRDACPSHVVFKTSDLGKSSRCYWIEIMRQREPFRDSRIDASLSRDGGGAGAGSGRGSRGGAGAVVEVRTENVSEFAIYPCGDMLGSGQLQVRIDGKAWTIGARAAAHPLVFAWRAGEFRMGETHTWGLTKSATSYGPIKQAYFSPFVLVYGTRGDARTTGLLLHQARLEAMQWWIRGNGSVEILPDSEVTDSTLAADNLVLFGGPEENTLTRRLNRHLPIKLVGGHVLVGDSDLGGEGLAAEFVYPNPLNPDKLVMVHEGIGIAGLKLSTYFGALSSAAGLPDYMIFDASVRTQGWAGVRRAGFFDSAWH